MGNVGILKSQLFIVLVFVFWLGLITIAVASPPGEDERKQMAAQEKAKPAAPSGADGDYIGSETCVICHQDQDRRFKNTVMGKAMAHPHTPEEARGCESCHGPGRTHVEAGGGKDTIPVRFGKDSPNSIAEQNAACEACHKRGDHIFWKGSPHESRGMACVDCHQVKQELHAALSSETRFNAPLTENRGVKKAPELCCSAIRCGGRNCSAPRTCRIAKGRLPALKEPTGHCSFRYETASSSTAYGSQEPRADIR